MISQWMIILLVFIVFLVGYGLYLSKKRKKK